MPGELPGFQETSRSALPQEPAKWTLTKAGGPEKLGSRPLTPIRHPPTSGQAVSRPGGRAENSPAKPPVTLLVVPGGPGLGQLLWA